MTNEPQLIPLHQLRADDDYQPRINGLDAQHVKLLLASDPDTWPPLLVTPNAAGGYDVLDGFHRLEAAHRLGRTALHCRVLADAGYPDSVAANLQHGLPLDKASRKAYARWLHEHYPEFSYRELGRRCGLNHETVKQALAGGENRQVGHSIRRHADPITKLMELAYTAVREGTGTSTFAQFFSGKTDRHQRAAYITTVLSSIEDEGQQYDVAEALYAFSVALYDATKPIVSGE